MADFLGGAGSGAAIGSAFAPGIGTAIGAGIGGLLSLFGGGETEAEKRQREAYEMQKKAWDTLQGVDTNVANRFNNYSTPFDYSAMKGVLDNIFAEYSGVLTKDANRQTQQSQKDIVARNASQGITSGSMLNTQTNKVSTDIGENLLDALTQLGIGRQQQEIPLMQQENQNKFNITSAATDSDWRKVQANLSKAGGVGGMATNNMNAANVYAQTNNPNKDYLAIADILLKNAPKGGYFGKN